MVIDTNIERMYYAGKHDIPNAADELSTIASRLYHHLVTFNKQSALAGDPAIMTSMLQVGGDLYDVLRGGVTSLNNCAGALIKTADDFVRTDEDARDDYRQMDGKLKNAPLPTEATTTPELTDPEAPGAVAPAPPIYGGNETIESTPDPEAPSVDAERRESQEDTSEYEHEREKRRG
jgi:hypothetical protein